MSEIDHPQLYLITPNHFDLSTFVPVFQECLDKVDIACVRLSLSSTDVDDWSRAADSLREITHKQDIPLIIDTHAKLVEPHGLDGVHLTDGSRSIAKVKKTLPSDAVVGSFCGTSRHDGMTAGEIGADYVCFGPTSETSLSDEDIVGFELFEWWSQMIEIPIVAEGNLTLENIREFTPVTDFFAVCDEVWSAEMPVEMLKSIEDILRGR